MVIEFCVSYTQHSSNWCIVYDYNSILKIEQHIERALHTHTHTLFSVAINSKIPSNINNNVMAWAHFNWNQFMSQSVAIKRCNTQPDAITCTACSDTIVRLRLALAAEEQKNERFAIFSPLFSVESRPLEKILCHTSVSTCLANKKDTFSLLSFLSLQAILECGEWTHIFDFYYSVFEAFAIDAQDVPISTVTARRTNTKHENKIPFFSIARCGCRQRTDDNGRSLHKFKMQNSTISVVFSSQYRARIALKSCSKWIVTL